MKMRRILIVEDNHAVREALGRLLSRRGYEVLLAADGRRGVFIATLEMPDLILMDLGMPVMDGWTATRTLKSTKATKDIPIIILSAHTMPTDREHAIAQGCDDFDTKPVKLDGLIERIEALLQKRAAA